MKQNRLSCLLMVLLYSYGIRTPPEPEPAPELEASSTDMIFSVLTVTRLSANYRAKALIPTEGEKNHKKGGLNCVFGNFFFYVLDNCPQVQSLN